MAREILKVGRLPCFLVGLAISPLSLGAQQAGDLPPTDPLEGLEATSRSVAWSGIELGMSLVQVERRSGLTLALTERKEADCGRWRARFDRAGLTIEAGFETGRPSAKLVWLSVQFEGYQLAASLQDLVQALQARLPQARYRPDPHLGSKEPFEDPSPEYELALGGRTVLIELLPREGMTLRLEGCRG